MCKLLRTRMHEVVSAVPLAIHTVPLAIPSSFSITTLALLNHEQVRIDSCMSLETALHASLSFKTCCEFAEQVCWRQSSLYPSPSRSAFAGRENLLLWLKCSQTASTHMSFRRHWLCQSRLTKLVSGKIDFVFFADEIWGLCRYCCTSHHGDISLWNNVLL